MLKKIVVDLLKSEKIIAEVNFTPDHQVYTNVLWIVKSIVANKKTF
jgi:hypothetical protein